MTVPMTSLQKKIINHFKRVTCGACFTNIKQQNVLHHPVQANDLYFNPYIYILYYYSNMPYNRTPSSTCYPFKMIYYICKGVLERVSGFLLEFVHFTGIYTFNNVGF